MRRFLDCKKGNFTVAFAIAVLPVLGAAGVAVDYSRALSIHSYLQVQADAAALSAARVGYNGTATAHLEYLKAATEQRFGSGSVTGLSVQPDWVTPVDYRIVVTAQMPVSVLSAVPGFNDTVPLSVTATARIAEPRYVYDPPELSELDNEAGDYNRVYVYCFDPVKAAAGGDVASSQDNDDDDNGKGKGKGKGKGGDKGKGKGKDDDNAGKGGAPVDGSGDGGRTQMTAIADNAGTKYTYVMPRCDAGQTLSFKLLNVRLARTEPPKWDDPKALHFEYYTDTQVVNGADKHDLDGWSVLETAICNSKKECDKKSKGGIVPEGKNRTPVQAKSTCSPGKYMYYGWEDRAPGMAGANYDWTDVAWTDRDYDDIRVVMKCPQLEEAAERMVRLVN
jgi:Flp pilus assembly protein TadG